MKVSTLLLTLNEAANLPDCLDGLSWCDDVLVLDSGSTDGTCEIAAQRGARVMTRPFDSFAAQRNHGLEHGELAHDWVLHLDADEIVTPAFAAALAALEPRDDVDAYRVPFKTIFFGRWLRHASMWPAYQVRLGHARRLRFVQIGHGQREATLPERVQTFEHAIEHYSFSHGLKAWLDKHVRYARDEADQLASDRRTKVPAGLLDADSTGRRRAAKALASRLPLWLRPVARFAYVFVWRRGFLDGRRGFVYAFMLSVYEGMIAVLSYERSMRDPQGGARRRTVAGRQEPAERVRSPADRG